MEGGGGLGVGKEELTEGGGAEQSILYKGVCHVCSEESGLS